ncbi:FGGY-family carbohydrate kinase [Mesorhizobium australafricanum]|uniref:FGGY-family carbohydrate kinase n=1 Tax=Mesorhizobium australafricanum TaxID=3072311 RepID=A0ABU4WVC2_9HYPH|nr:FGGY-family carbohydrate kinase [Mesorhizobium sp. VK3E]MDX8438950.1 FGGY-family carbohydrate kinase [Mesorhizobium sp. VK3E]
MRAMNVAIERIVVVGGGAGSSLWLQTFADSTGLSVIRSLSNEASALGAGMCAAVGAGWYQSFASATCSMTRIAEQIDPSPRSFLPGMNSRNDKRTFTA